MTFPFLSFHVVATRSPFMSFPDGQIFLANAGISSKHDLRSAFYVPHKMQDTPSASPLPEKSFALQNLFQDFFIKEVLYPRESPSRQSILGRRDCHVAPLLAMTNKGKTLAMTFFFLSFHDGHTALAKHGISSKHDLKSAFYVPHKMQDTPSASPLPEKSFALQNLFRDFFIKEILYPRESPSRQSILGRRDCHVASLLAMTRRGKPRNDIIKKE